MTPPRVEGAWEARRGASQDEIRRHNLSALLTAVHRQGPRTRAELTAQLGLNRSTILALVGDLSTAGMVTEEPPVVRRGAGRPSLVVKPCATEVYALAAVVEVESVTLAAIGLGGVVLDRVGLAQDRERAAPELAVETIARLGRRLRRRRPATSRLVGVGVAVAGVVRREDGLVHFGPNLGWRDVPFGEMLAAELGPPVPVRVGNNADLGALGEHARGVAAELDNVVYLAGEVGVGGGVIVDGRPLYGSAGYGGEVGHMVVNPQGRACRCGSRGCWETEVGEDALLRRAGHPLGGGRAAVLEVLEAAAGGDADALTAVGTVGRWLGNGVATIVNLFNPQMVIFGGLLSDIYPAAAAIVEQRLAAAALAAPRALVRLAVPVLGADSTLHGAAELAFGPLLADPLAPAAAATVTKDTASVLRRPHRSPAGAVAGSGR